LSPAPGYDKSKRVVWVCLKDRYHAFINNKWNPEQMTSTIRLLAGRLFGNIHSKQEATNINSLDEKMEQAIKDRKQEQKSFFTEERMPFWKELAFYSIEVKKVTLAPGEGLGSNFGGASGVIDPGFYEVEVDISQDGEIRPEGVRVLRNPDIDPIYETVVPRGAGQSVQEYRNNLSLSASLYPGSSAKSAQIRRHAQSNANFYNSECLTSKDSQIAWDGDAWYGGLMSSIRRGVYEFWTDDLGMGPMKAASRRQVTEAMARYQRNTASAEQRYATERDNPNANTFASTAITPVKTYIEDWFGDPGFYIGLANFLMQIASGFDDPDDKNEYNKRYFDQGVTDYSRIYNKYEGIDI
jgi:hypothetical protein